MCFCAAIGLVLGVSCYSVEWTPLRFRRHDLCLHLVIRLDLTQLLPYSTALVLKPCGTPGSCPQTLYSVPGSLQLEYAVEGVVETGGRPAHDIRLELLPREPAWPEDPKSGRPAEGSRAACNAHSAI